ncbi:MAG: hypothetical protein AAF281_01635 [Pseudomonadota bacterium]
MSAAGHRPGWRGAAALLLPLLGACGAELGGAAPAGGAAAPAFLSAAVTKRDGLFTEVSVSIANPTRDISAERYAACVIAADAQARGEVWIERLRGARRIRGAEEDLTVLYRTDRLKPLRGDTVFTAALTQRLCELDEIPTGARQSAGQPPVVALSGAEPPSVTPNLVATELPPGPEAETLPVPPPGDDSATGL